MLLAAWQQTESNFTASVLGDFDVIFCAAINTNNYKSHQMCIQIQSIAFMLSFQEMHCRQAMDFILSFEWDYYLAVTDCTNNLLHQKVTCLQAAKTCKAPKYDSMNSHWMHKYFPSQTHKSIASQFHCNRLELCAHI